jgi:hypothetical protein
MIAVPCGSSDLRLVPGGAGEVIASPGRARSWQIAAALTEVRKAFSVDKVYVSRSTLGGAVMSIGVSSGPVEDPRPDEAAVARLIEGAVPKIARGELVELGLGPPAPPRGRLDRLINRPWPRVPPESQACDLKLA